MSDQRGSAAFKDELTFWQSNLARIEHDALESKSSSTPFQGPRQ
jgi:hypothetical protein